MKHLKNCSVLLVLVVGCEPIIQLPDSGASDAGRLDSGAEGGGTGGNGGFDAGSAQDGGAGRDAGVDSGSRMDAGTSLMDAGVVLVDASAPVDSGVVDAGAIDAEVDAGVADSGGPMDGSVPPDSGVAVEDSGIGNGGSGGSSPVDAGTALLDLVSFEGVVAQVAVGQTIRANVVWRNSSVSPIEVTEAVIAGRAPGATREGGPYDDFGPVKGPTVIAPGETLEMMASLLPRPILGEWETYPTYRDQNGAWQDYAGKRFSIVADQEYGTFENIIWPIADPDDPPNEDRRFAYACYVKSSTQDSAVCRARYGLGTLPYQTNPDSLSAMQEQCETDGGVYLQHACPTNQMLQLCWEDTRSPAWVFSCEYYGDPNNKSPQMPGSAPDIVFYNDHYSGRDPRP